MLCISLDSQLVEVLTNAAIMTASQCKINKLVPSLAKKSGIATLLGHILRCSGFVASYAYPNDGQSHCVPAMVVDH